MTRKFGSYRIICCDNIVEKMKDIRNAKTPYECLIIEERYKDESIFLFSKLPNGDPIPDMRLNVIMQIYLSRLYKKSKKLNDLAGLCYMLKLTALYLSIIDKYNEMSTKLPF